MNQALQKKSLIARYPFYFLTIGILMVFQIIWHFYMHEPWRNGDLTLETVQTILKEGFSYHSNPLTGQDYTVGAPSRWKVLLLPYVYAFFSQITGIAPQVVMFQIVPVLVLVLCYVIYAGYARFLFPEDGKKQCGFMLAVVLLFQFGDYAQSTQTFLLFHAGYEGIAIRAALLLPLTLLACLQKKWWLVVLCALVEAATVWTFYGLGYVVLEVAAFLALQEIVKIWKKNRGQEA